MWCSMSAERCRTRAGTLAACGVALCALWVVTPEHSAGATSGAARASRVSSTVGMSSRDTAPGRIAARGTPPAVQVMVVGRRRTLFAARSVRAGRVRVRVGRRRCALAAGTPLGALARARSAGALILRDYGRCSGSTASSGQLFVRGIGPDRSRSGGRDGWEYKVDQRSGTTGAGDPSGSFGDGRRLRAGQHVLWFWCVMTAAGGCQRTLGLALGSGHAAPGAPVTVTVTGYDNEGRGMPVAGADVTAEGVHATTDASGRATLTAPAQGGRHLLSASRPGLVPSFPVTLSVG